MILRKYLSTYENIKKISLWYTFNLFYYNMLLFKKFLKAISVGLYENHVEVALHCTRLGACIQLQQLGKPQFL